MTFICKIPYEIIRDSQNFHCEYDDAMKNMKEFGVI